MLGIIGVPLDQDFSLLARQSHRQRCRHFVPQQNPDGKDLSKVLFKSLSHSVLPSAT